MVVSTPGGRLPGNDEPLRIDLVDRRTQSSEVAGQRLRSRKIDVSRLLEHRVGDLDSDSRFAFEAHEVIGDALAREKPLKYGRILTTKEPSHGDLVTGVGE